MKTQNHVRSLLVLGLLLTSASMWTLTAQADRNGTRPDKVHLQGITEEALVPGAIATETAFTNPGGANEYLAAIRVYLTHHADLWEYGDSFGTYEAKSNSGGSGTGVSLELNYYDLTTGAVYWAQWFEITWADGSVEWGTAEGTTFPSEDLTHGEIAGVYTVEGGTKRFGGASGGGTLTGSYPWGGLPTIDCIGRISTVGSNKNDCYSRFMHDSSPSVAALASDGRGFFENMTHDLPH